MKSKPMLFSAPMVLALLQGRKTQTRRKMKQQPAYPDTHPPDQFQIQSKIRHSRHPVGSEIWVKEKARCSALREVGEVGSSIDVTYAADGFEQEHHYPQGGIPKWFPGMSRNKDGSMRWQSAMFMPRWASRITLKVKDVRVQRLQDISEEDAIAEGILEDGAGWCGYKTAKVTGPWQRHPEDAYRDLWESINGPGSWEANTFVWAYTFEVKK